MNKWIARISAAVLVSVMAMGAVGVVAAQGPDGNPGGRQGGPQHPLLSWLRQDSMMSRLVDAIESATGLTRDDVVAQLQDGKSFNQILEENNIDPQVVIDAVTGVLTEELNQAVADGKITEERAAQVLENLPENLDRLMNATLPEDRPIRDRIQSRLDDSLVGVLAEMAGVDVKDLLAEALTPPSLSDIATEHGLDADAIIAEAEQRITDDVNQAVADGQMTEEDAAAILDGLHDRLVERFDAPLLRPLRNLFDGRMPGGRGPRLSGGI
jgi:polyhydroxyalkanoate synthesis regulator phasin